jgi:hypothetical protein
MAAIAAPQVSLDIGTCSVVTDPEPKGHEEVCGSPGVAEVLVRNDFGLFMLILCAAHKKQHTEFYQARLRRRGGPVRRRRHT